jgi:hypothetical protein
MLRNPPRAATRVPALYGLLGAVGAFAGGQSAAQQPPPAEKKCEVAVVNPVTGYAECVKPRGAPVDQPPPRPAPSPEECLKHPDLDVEACRQQAPPRG